MKKILAILVVLLIILVVAVVGATFFLGSIVKKGVETIGPQVAKVDVKLDSVKLSVLSGEGTLKGFILGNPPGFKSPSAVEVGEISVALQPRSVLSDKLVVRSVRVISPTITLEGLKGDNLNKILENMQGPAAGGGKEQKPPPAAKKPDASQKKIEIDDLVLRDGKVNLVLPPAGAFSVPLPEIHLTDLGKDSGGLTPSELSAKVIKAILNGAMSSAAKGGQAPVKLMEGAGKDAEKQAEKALKGVGNLLK